jgi:hypothetical protein
MGKLFKLSEETQELIDKTITEVGLENYMNFKCFGIKKQKQVFKVKKASPTEEGMGNSPDTVIILVAEEVLERLSKEQQELLVHDAINQIFYDDEKDKIVVTQPEICVTIGGRQKYGEDLINAVETSIMVRLQIEEEEKERKAAEKKRSKQ